MNSSEKHNRVICDCCRSVFGTTDAVTTYIKLYDKEIPEKRCPFCGGTFRLLELPKELDIYLYVNRDERYYTYPDTIQN